MYRNQSRLWVNSSYSTFLCRIAGTGIAAGTPRRPVRSTGRGHKYPTASSPTTVRCPSGNMIPAGIEKSRARYCHAFPARTTTACPSGSWDHPSYWAASHMWTWILSREAEEAGAARFAPWPTCLWRVLLSRKPGTAILHGTTNKLNPLISDSYSICKCLIACSYTFFFHPS
jgi:hypothetical protein